MSIFINHANHSSSQWTAEQLTAAEVFGEIIDIEFPAVAANADEVEVQRMVDANLMIQWR